jgi:hypothetical protein
MAQGRAELMAWEVVIIDDEYEITTAYGEYTDYDDAVRAKEEARSELEDGEEFLRVEIRRIPL